VEDWPVSQIAASLDGVHWYPLSVPWTSRGSVQEALAISDSGVIMWTDTVSALYVSLDGGLTFGLCTDSPPFGQRSDRPRPSTRTALCGSLAASTTLTCGEALSPGTTIRTSLRLWAGGA
jgi:hypothetical protein